MSILDFLNKIESSPNTQDYVIPDLSEVNFSEIRRQFFEAHPELTKAQSYTSADGIVTFNMAAPDFSDEDIAAEAAGLRAAINGVYKSNNEYDTLEENDEDFQDWRDERSFTREDLAYEDYLDWKELRDENDELRNEVVLDNVLELPYDIGNVIRTLERLCHVINNDLRLASDNEYPDYCLKIDLRHTVDISELGIGYTTCMYPVFSILKSSRPSDFTIDTAYQLDIEINPRCIDMEALYDELKVKIKHLQRLKFL